ncbi:MAG: hypothetical protein JXR40_06730 [Pontiellaceae bacterium]|nr:hypothetical protein [Pontiellaceae bacterium]
MTEFREEMLCNWILAGGTILLSLTALFGGWFRMLLSVPRLRLELKKEKAEVITPADKGNCYFYHLRIFNKRRKAPAHNVRVLLNSIYRPNPEDGKMCKISFAGPVQLAWQYQHSTSETQTIGPEMTCDLGWLSETMMVFSLSLLLDHQQKVRISTNASHELPIPLSNDRPTRSVPFDSMLRTRQKMVIGIMASGDECDSKELKLEISYDGGWGPDAIKIQQVRALSSLNI